MQVDESGNVTSFHNMGSNVQNPHDPAGLNHAQQAVAIRFLMVGRQSWVMKFEVSARANPKPSPNQSPTLSPYLVGHEV